jgi:MFS transporter, YNFM family, putative membrane transport protein
MSSTDSVRNAAASQGLLFAALALAVFAGAASMRIMDALLPAVARQYGESIGTTSMTITAYALSYSGCQLFYGPLGDRLGPYVIVSWTAMLSAGAALCCAWAPSLAWLVFCRFIAGGIAAAIGPLALMWVGHVTSVAERPVIVARMTSASILGTTLGQVSGGLFGQLLDWRASFVMIALLFTSAGIILARAGAGRSEARGIGRVVQMKSDHAGTSYHHLFLRPGVRRTLLWVGLEGFATYMSLTYAATILQRQLAIGLASTGVIVGFFGVGGVAFALLARHFMRWWPASRRAVLGGTLAAMGLGLMILVHSPVSAAICMFGTGLGFFALHNILQVRATHMAPDAPGTAISLFAATFFLAQAIGAVLGGWGFDRFGPTPSCAASAAILFGLGIAVGCAVKRCQDTEASR